MPTEKKLFSAVDALLKQVAQDDLPPPAERKRLRTAAGLTQTQIANALEIRREAVGNWEAGKTEPRSPQRAAYARLLENLAARFPAPDAESDTAPAVPETFPGTSAPPLEAEALAAAPPSEAAAMTGSENTAHRSTSNAAARAAASRPERTAGPSSTSRQPDARKATANAPAGGAEPRFANGPLAVVDVDADSQVLAYCLGGLVLDEPAKSIPSLVDWTLKKAKLGEPLTQRGFGPWARISRPAQDGMHSCGQLCMPSWHALDTRHWEGAEQLPPSELAQLLGTYASWVMTPRGATAVTGLELLTALHPTTRASEPDETGKRHRRHNPGSLGEHPVQPVPCEVPDGLPLLADLPRFLRRTQAEVLTEEAYAWARPLDFLPCQDGEPLPGGWRLGVSPGRVKHKGTQSGLWGEGVREQFNAPELNLARSIETGEATNEDEGE